jgi:integrase
MARTVVDSNLRDRTARARLSARAKPYYRLIEPGLHLGYRKPRGRRGKPGVAGKWLARFYVGKQAYEIETIGIADDYSDADGVVVLDFKQAQDRAREKHVQRAHAAAGVAGPLTVASAVEMYLEHLANDGKTVDTARHHANAFIIPVLGDVEVATLTAKQIRRWHYDLAKMPARVRTKKGAPQQHRQLDGSEEAIRRRRSTANRIYTTLRAALNYAWREKKVTSDAEWRRVEPFRSVDGVRVRYLTVAEAQRFINASDPEFRPLAMAALQTGARYGELSKLKVGDFDEDAGTLAVYKGKKSKPRHVILTDEGQDVFRQLTVGRNPEELLLHRADGSAWGENHQDRFVAAANARAKIEPPIGIHILRHTWASHAVMNGVPLMVVAKNLGHVDTKMVERHYGHLAPSFVADAIRAGAPRFGFEPSNVTPLTPLQKRGG